MAVVMVTGMKLEMHRRCNAAGGGGGGGTIGFGMDGRRVDGWIEFGVELGRVGGVDGDSGTAEHVTLDDRRWDYS